MPLLYEMLDTQRYQQKNQEIQTLYAYYFEDYQTNNQLHNSEHVRLSSIKKQL
jgi:hypothetical protein